MSDDIVIVGMARTPMGGLQGELSGYAAPDLGAIAVKAAVLEAAVRAPDQIIMGNVLSAGQGQAPARQAALHAGLPTSTEAVTLNKMCGSGLQAVAMARQALLAGEANAIVAGGMESMSRAPFLLTSHRSGKKYGHDKMLDHMAFDGLEDAYEGLAMGVFADQAAKDYQLTRQQQDAYALVTLERAQKATAQGRFKREIAPVETKAGIIDTDELPRKAKPEKIPSLKPAFTEGGTVTAANASAISDGAAALVLMRRSDAEKQGKTILARIVAQSSHAQEPSKFTSAPVPAIQKALQRAGWKVGDVDLWEINEAFAVVPLIAMKELGIGLDQLNVNGGACALGHPIGASGARVLVTLLAAMEAQNAKRGVASLCIGGGEGIALAVERN
jgi:acetyl-CoA C-acetyltransferase